MAERHVHTWIEVGRGHVGNPPKLVISYECVGCPAKKTENG